MTDDLLMLPDAEASTKQTKSAGGSKSAKKPKKEAISLLDDDGEED
jgi:hypothetical protein